MLLMKRPVSVSSFSNLRGIKKYERTFNTIIDVGANKGQFALAARYFYPGSKLYCFEPSKKNYLSLQKHFKDDLQVKLFNYGLGDQNGELEFFEHAFDQISSFLKVNPANSNPNYKDSVFSASHVVVKKLDDIMGELDINSPVLLKLDVQGFEASVLFGAKNSLKMIDYIMIELSFEELYEKQKLFNEMHLFISSLGFDLMAPIGFNIGKENNIIEIDALYKKKG